MEKKSYHDLYDALEHCEEGYIQNHCARNLWNSSLYGRKILL